MYMSLSQNSTKKPVWTPLQFYYTNKNNKHCVQGGMRPKLDGGG